MPKKLILLFLLALLIRLPALNQSLWLDEAISANVVKNFSYLDIITKFSPGDFHPPLYYLILKSWTSIFGFSEISLRLPSVIFSLITGFFVYLIGKKLKDKNVAFWSAAFFLVNPLIIYYSQEARMYSLVTLLLTATLYFHLVSSLRSPVSIILLNLFSFLSLLTFYGSIFFLLPLLFLDFRSKKSSLQSLTSSFYLIPALLLLSPLLYHQYTLSKTLTFSIPNWTLVLGKSNLKNLFMIPLKFSFGHLSFYPKWLYYLISLPWTLFIFLNAFFLKIKISNFKFQILFAFPLFLAFVISFSSPMLQYFRYLYLIPTLCLLLAIALHNSIFRYLVFAGFTILSLVYLFFPQFHREDWKSLATSLPPNSVVYMIPSFADPLKYYRPDITIADIRTPPSVSANSITVIPYGTAIYAFDHRFHLANSSYHFSSASSFREITKETWSKN